MKNFASILRIFEADLYEKALGYQFLKWKYAICMGISEKM